MTTQKSTFLGSLIFAWTKVWFKPTWTSLSTWNPCSSSTSIIKKAYLLQPTRCLKRGRMCQCQRGSRPNFGTTWLWLSNTRLSLAQVIPLGKSLRISLTWYLSSQDKISLWIVIGVSFARESSVLTARFLSKKWPWGNTWTCMASQPNHTFIMKIISKSS